MRGTRWRLLGVGLGISALLGSVVLAVLADDPKPEVKPDAKAAAKAAEEMPAKVAELEARTSKHVAEKADVALGDDIQAAVSLSRQASDARLRARLVRLLGAILAAGPRQSGVDQAAIRGLGAMGDPAGFVFVRAFLVLPDFHMNPPLLIDAIEAASKMRSDDSVSSLLLLVQKSAVEPVAVAAVKAFSTFGQNKMTREKILASLVDVLRLGMARPLSGPIVETLNKMTGREIAGADGWIDLVRRFRDHPADLFN